MQGKQENISALIPLYQEMAYQDSSHVFAAVAREAGAILLDSANCAQPFQDTNRYSYIVFAPFITITVKNGVCLENQNPVTDPFAIIKEYLQQFSNKRITSLPPFQGGAAGYFAYDICQYLENISLPRDDLNFPDMAMGFYDVVISFDHTMKKCWVISTGFPEIEKEAQFKRANQRLIEVVTLLENNAKKEIVDIPQITSNQNIISNVKKDEYINKVERAKNYILEGDIFEVNISQRFTAKLPKELTAYQLYQRLRQINPAPFAAYINLGEGRVIASASPERFLSVQNGKVETRPIKGTVRRSNSLHEDKVLAETLINSTKDRAENVMIVDLMRNDLSRVCTNDSVEVTTLCGLESYATVHHLVSVINAQLRADIDSVDLLKATLPGGSITGAPKIRAMEIIAELEPNRRGPYCGSIAYISFTGDMDTSIIIRTYVIKEDEIRYQTGGAVVLNSDPELEYQETLDKAKALKVALMGEP